MTCELITREELVLPPGVARNQVEQQKFFFFTTKLCGLGLPPALETPSRHPRCGSDYLAISVFFALLLLLLHIWALVAFSTNEVTT